MCQSASFIITERECLWSRFSDEHRVIRAEHGIDEMQKIVTAVPCEVVPRDNDYRLPFDQWIFGVDLPRDQWPEWFSAADAEKQCRDNLSKWAETHVYRTGSHTFGGGSLSLIFLGDAHAEIKNQQGGECRFNESSTGTVSGQQGGKCRFRDSSKKIQA